MVVMAEEPPASKVLADYVDALGLGGRAHVVGRKIDLLAVSKPYDLFAAF
jgi:hypothetical protein